MAGGLSAEPAAPRSHVTASLLAEEASVTPGRSVTLGIRLQMDPGWHTYWKNPGDSGLPTRVQWRLPEGIEPGPLLWPIPERFGKEPVVSYGHAGDTLLLSEVAVGRGVTAGQTLRIGVRVKWLECRDVCRPGSRELELDLPVRGEPSPPGRSAHVFAEARRRLPAPPQGWTLSVGVEADGYRLAFQPPRSVALNSAYFYPAERGLLDHAAPQELRSGPGGRVLGLTRDPNRRQATERLTGVLVTEGRSGMHAVHVDLPLAGAGDRVRNDRRVRRTE